MDKPTIGDDSLKNLTKLFTRFGWDKRLSELSEEQILTTILIMQFSKRLEEDEQYTEDRLNKLLLEYVSNYDKQSKPVDEDPIPFLNWISTAQVRIMSDEKVPTTPPRS